MNQPPESIRVLHVDDEPGFADTVADFLERQDDRLSVETATSATEGLDRLADTALDCIVSDYDMPDMDGIEFLEAVRAEHSDLPFILFTGKGSERVASEAISAGVTDYLRKDSGFEPEQFELLANRIENAVESTRAHRQYQRSTCRFEAVLEDPQMLVGVLDPDGTLREVNHTAMEFVDARHDAAVGDPFWETPWWSEDIHDDVRQWVERAANGEYVEFEADLTDAGGRSYSVEGTIRPVTNDDEIISLVASAQDVTDRKRREQELNVRVEAMEASIDGMSILNSDGEYVFVNQAHADIYGYDDPDAFLGKTWRTCYDADEEERLEDEVVPTLAEGESWRGEAVGRCKDGSTFSQELSLSVTDGGRMICVVRDVTDRKEYERELQRKNERLDGFASVVSHDLRNPLNVVEGRLDLARDECDSAHLDDAADAVSRSLALIDALLTLAREGKRVGDVEAVDLVETVEGCWTTVETDDATLVVEAERTIRADRRRLQQLLENLIRNAVEHGGEDVTVIVGDLDERAGFYVADDGTGLSEDEREKVFEAGYSTTHEGTGLGLTIVREIAEAHGWDVRVADGPAGGARFEVVGVATASADR